MTPWRARLALLVAAGLGLAACIPGPPRPEVDAGSAPRRVWLPDDEPPRAVILALHGFNDYSNAFAEFGAYAAAQGIAVHAYDQRGFGANPDAGFWPGTAVLVGDLRRELERLDALYPDRPIYLLGASMGGAVIMAALGEGRPLDVAGVILVAPAVWGGDQLNPLYRATLWLMVHVAPGLELSGRGLEIQPSDNVEMLRAISADPLVIKGTRVDAVAGLVDLMDLAYGEAERLPGPILVLGGARDEVVPPEAQVAVRARLRARPCEEVVYPEGYHMLLRDLQRRVVWRDVLAWIDGEPLPSGLATACADPALSPDVAALE